MFNIKALSGKQLGSRKTGATKHKKTSSTGTSIHESNIEKTFAGALEQTQDQQHIDDLHKFIGEIQEQGDILKRYPNKQEFLKYKSMISAFLRQIVRESLKINKKQIHRKNQEQVTADIINEKVYKLGQYLLLEEEDTLEIAAAIDEIRGMLFDSFTAISADTQI